jgi:hypothetical protein
MSKILSNTVLLEMGFKNGKLQQKLQKFQVSQDIMAAVIKYFLYDRTGNATPYMYRVRQKNLMTFKLK